MLARRLNGKYLAPHCDHLDERIAEINNGKYELLLEDLMGKPIEQIESDTDRDYFMTAEQALEYGIIDKIYTHRD